MACTCILVEECPVCAHVGDGQGSGVVEVDVVGQREDLVLVGDAELGVAAQETPDDEEDTLPHLSSEGAQ